MSYYYSLILYAIGFFQVQFQRGAEKPENIAIVHGERYAFPTGPGGSCVTTGVSNVERRVTVHARYRCVVERYPYFRSYMLKIPIADLLEKEHWDHLWQQLGIDKSDYIT